MRTTYYKSQHSAPSLSMSSSTKPRKTVWFDTGTNFEPSRPHRSYQRTSHIYAPGKHHCPDGEQWEDTSFMTDFMYQLDHHKVLQRYKTEATNSEQVRRHLKSMMNINRKNAQSICRHNLMLSCATVQSSPARQLFRTKLEQSLSRPTRSLSQEFMKGLLHANGLTLLQKSDDGSFLAYDWVTDTRSDQDANAFISNLKRAVPQENRGENRIVTQSRIDGEVTSQWSLCTRRRDQR
jgi:hypothetical protein